MKKEGQKNNKKEFLIKKGILIFASLIIIVFLLVGGYYFFKPKNKFVLEIGKTKDIENPLEYLVQREDGEYIISKANNDIAFAVETKDKEVKYKVTDEHKNEYETIITKKDNEYIINPKTKYEPGKIYTIELTNATFKDEALKDIKKLHFKIVRENVYTQEFNDNVKKETIKNITVKEKDNQYELTNKSNKKYKKDDVLIVENGYITNAYKIMEIKNNKLIAVDATLQEIYSSLDVYGEYAPDLNEFQLTDKIKEHIELAIDQNNLIEKTLDSLLLDINTVKVLAKETSSDEDGKLKHTITLELIGEHGVLNKFLKKEPNHKVTVNITYEFQIKIFYDITLFAHDIGAILTLDTSIGAKVEFFDKQYDSIKEKLQDAVSAKVKNFKDLQKKLKQGGTDELEKKMSIGRVDIPTPVIGLTSYVNLNTLFELKLSVELEGKLTRQITATVGHHCPPNIFEKCDFYFNVSKPTKTKPEVSATGTVELKVGLLDKVGIKYFGVVDFNFELQAGGYFSGDATVKEDKKNIKDMIIVSEVSAGTFVEIELEVKATDFLKTKTKLYERKWPLFGPIETEVYRFKNPFYKEPTTPVSGSGSGTSGGGGGSSSGGGNTQNSNNNNANGYTVSWVHGTRVWTDQAHSTWRYTWQTKTSITVSKGTTFSQACQKIGGVFLYKSGRYGCVINGTSFGHPILSGNETILLSDRTITGNLSWNTKSDEYVKNGDDNIYVTYD